MTELLQDEWLQEIPGTHPRKTRAVTAETRAWVIQKRMEADTEQAALDINMPTYEEKLVKAVQALWPLALCHAAEYARQRGAKPGNVHIKHQAILNGARDLLKEKGYEI